MKRSLILLSFLLLSFISHSQTDEQKKKIILNWWAGDEGEAIPPNALRTDDGDIIYTDDGFMLLLDN